MKKQIKREASRFVGALILATIAVTYLAYRGEPVDAPLAVGAVLFCWFVLLGADQ